MTDNEYFISYSFRLPQRVSKEERIQEFVRAYSGQLAWSKVRSEIYERYGYEATDLTIKTMNKL